MKKLLPILIALATLSSCRITRDRCNQLYPPVETHSTDTVLQVRETIVHDTITVAADYSELELTLKADTNNNVVVDSVTTISGFRSQVKIDSSYTIGKKLHLSVACKCDSVAIYREYVRRDTSLSVKNTDTKIQLVEAPPHFTWWQHTKLSFGGYAMGAWLILLLILLGRLAWKIFKVATPQGAAISAGEGLFSGILKLFKRGP